MIDVIGEALIDVHVEGSAIRAYPGGGPFNTAIALAHLGVPVAFRSPLSADAFGELLDETLSQSGVTTGDAPRVATPTPLALVAHVSNEADYSFYLRGTAFELLAEHLDASEPPTATFVGSLALALDPPAEAVAEHALAVAERSALVIDPNVRAALLGNPEALRTRLERLAPVGSVIKLSRADAAWLYSALDADDVAGHLLELGASCVVITDGARGASGWTDRGRVRCESPCVTVVDTIGAGDAFTAGFLARLWHSGTLAREHIAALDDDGLVAALAYGSAAGAAQCERASAWGPSASDVERLLNDDAFGLIESATGG